ncbi:MAG TPA: L,D-transpeptidase family protein [Lysobacter sp.]|nr:L,D-transpeptidase family protein [Lysobacter sp.]
MNRILVVTFALMLLLASPAHASSRADEVRVDKSERMLLLYRQGDLIKSYRISLGPVPVGDKIRDEDGRTPEGRFRIDAKDLSDKYYKAIRATALASPDSIVVIHGQRPALTPVSAIVKMLDWTDGSIALSNRDMDEFWEAIGPGTELWIEP